MLFSINFDKHINTYVNIAQPSVDQAGKTLFSHKTPIF